MQSQEIHSVNLYRIYVPEYGSKNGSLFTPLWFIAALFTLFIMASWLSPSTPYPAQQVPGDPDQAASVFEYPSRHTNNPTLLERRSFQPATARNGNSRYAALREVEPIPSDLSLTEKFASLLAKKEALEKTENLAQQVKMTLLGRSESGFSENSWAGVESNRPSERLKRGENRSPGRYSAYRDAVKQPTLPGVWSANPINLSLAND